ncbi:MAG: FGGY-family carbohydrate kinase [Promethearchaeota archaeon]
MKILAIDIGTQSIRAAILNHTGSILSISQEIQEINSPYPGWAQQKPKIWWTLTKKVVSDVLLKSKVDRSSIKAICTCGQMHGPVGIDNRGNITTEWTQIWMDKRCEDICKQLRKNNDESELAEKITGNPITSGWLGIKVRWIKENQPEVYKKTRYFLVPKDFINFMISKVAATDHSEASGTYLYDYNIENYSSKMADIIDIDLEKFAPIHNSYDIIGNITEDFAKEFSLSPDTPVLAGGGDFLVSLLGLGLINEKIAIDMTGTSTLFVIYKEQPIVQPMIQNLRHVIKGWVPFTILDCGGLSMKWFKDFLNSSGKAEISFDEIIKMAESIPIGSDGLLFYPYMLGERRKENNLARGCFFGINLNHTIANFARAVMEGVSLALGKDIQIFKELGINIEHVICVGGATRNKLLYQIKSDVMQIPHILMGEPEASLRGCGLLSAYGLGLIKNFDNLNDINEIKITKIHPDKTVAEKYNNLLIEFKKLYSHLLGYWS